MSGVLLSKKARAELLPPVISAVQITGGEGKANQDYIELFNPNSEPFNLNGYKLVKRSQFGVTDVSVKSFSTDVFVPPYSFYLWANSTFVEISNMTDSATSSTLADNNGIGLRLGSLDTGSLVESLSWGDTSNGFATTGLRNPSAGESITRIDLFKPSIHQISNSAPRNSSIQLLPQPVENPVVEDVPVVEEEPSPETAQQPPIDSEEPIVEEPSEEDSLGSVEDANDVPEPVVEVENPVEEVSIKISEILPNPTGVDSGKESIELFNASSNIVNLDGWILDDVENYSLLSSNALIFEEVLISPGEYLKVALPKGKFTLNNSEGDIVSLFDEAGNLKDQVSYFESAQEGKSYSLLNDEWFWILPSLGEANPEEVDTTETDQEESGEEENLPSQEGLLISELYPSPNKGQDEFVEIYNNSNRNINLTGAELLVGNKKISLPNFLLSAGGYYVLSGKALKLPLANSGKNIQLISNQGEILDEVVYTKAPVGQSYSLFDDEYEWTTTVTPKAMNVLSKPVLKEVKEKTVNSQEDKKLSPKKTQSKSTVAKKASSVKKASPSALTKTEKANIDKPSVLVNPQQDGKNNNFDFKGIIAIVVATLGAGGFALYRFGL